MRRHATFSSKLPLSAPRRDGTSSSNARLRAVPAHAPSLIWESWIPRAVTRSMLGSLAHDVRSPLMALSMNLHGIEERVRESGAIDPALVELFEDAREACAAVAEKIELVRGQTSDSATAERFSVQDVVATTVRFFRWHAQQRGIRVVVEVDAAMTGFGHAAEIGWTLLHALVRVSDATAPGETVHVRATEREDAIRLRTCGAEEIEVLLDPRGELTTRQITPRR